MSTRLGIPWREECQKDSENGVSLSGIWEPAAQLMNTCMIQYQTISQSWVVGYALNVKIDKYTSDIDLLSLSFRIHSFVHRGLLCLFAWYDDKSSIESGSARLSWNFTWVRICGLYTIILSDSWYSARRSRIFSFIRGAGCESQHSLWNRVVVSTVAPSIRPLA